MKKYLAAVLLAGFIQTATAIDTFDSNSNVLTLDSVVVGGTLFHNVTVLLDSYYVLSVGSSEQYIPDACGPDSLTTTHYNMIQVGMTLDQIDSIVGCKYDAGNIYRTASNLTYVWRFQNRTLYVLFDLNGYRSLNVSGTFKVAIGF